MRPELPRANGVGVMGICAVQAGATSLPRLAERVVASTTSADVRSRKRAASTSSIGAGCHTWRKRVAFVRVVAGDR
jgi:hypothetical protein